MATQFINKADATATIGETQVDFSSNTVTAELLTNETISIVKSQSQDVVVSGSEIVYTIVITNNGTYPLTDVDFFDTIPTGLTYKVGSFKVNTVTETPITTGQDLSYVIASLPAGNTTVEFTVTVD